MLKEIQEAICEILAMASRFEREDLIVCFSPLTKRILIEEIYLQSTTSLENYKSVFGVEINEYWPYNNEIVVYHKENVSFNPKLLKKIPVTYFKSINKTQIK